MVANLLRRLALCTFLIAVSSCAQHAADVVAPTRPGADVAALQQELQHQLELQHIDTVKGASELPDDPRSAVYDLTVSTAETPFGTSEIDFKWTRQLPGDYNG